MKGPILRAEAFKRLRGVTKSNQNEIQRVKDNLDIQLLQEKVKAVTESNRKTTLANNRYEAETFKLEADTGAVLASTEASKILTSNAKFDLTVKVLKYGSATLGTGLAIFGSSDIISSGGDIVDIVDIFGDLGTAGIDPDRSNTTGVEAPTLAEQDRSKLKSYLDKFLKLVTK
jgi:hypothetical protein